MIRAHAGTGGHAMLACLTLLAAGCGSQALPPRHPGHEWLESIAIDGNKAISDKKLREGLALRRVQAMGESPDPYLVSVDANRIKGVYVRAGFLEVDVRSRVERRGHATKVFYTVTEGPRATTRVQITGLPTHDPDLTTAMVRAALPLEDGEPFSYARYDDAKEHLLALAEDAGYARAELDTRVVVDRVRHEAIVRLDYTTGPKCTFGSIRVLGISGDVADAVRARVTFETGDTYSAHAIAATQHAIYEMKRFSMVRVLPDNGSGDVVDVRISLSRSTRNELVTGGGLGMSPISYEVRGRTGYSRIGFPLPLTDFSADLRPSYAMMRDGSGYEPRIRAMTQLRRLDLFRPFVVGEVEAGYSYLTVEAYTSYGPRGQLGLESPLFTRRLQGRVGWEIEHLDFRQISPLIDEGQRMDLGLDGPQRVGQYSQTLVLDLRDKPIEPTIGVYAEARVDEGTAFAGSAVEFFRITPQLRGYLSIDPVPVILAARVRYGRVYGDIPVTERYYSGGATTQRGFAERRLAPFVRGEVDGSERSVPFGGAELFESNVEVRTRVGSIKGVGLGGVAFLDGADVVDGEQTIDLGNLHWAAGFGLRLYTVVGAVRADIGFRLNRTGAMEPDPDSRFAFHLSIGEAY